MSRRPNIVIINPDQMRADSLAHLGNPASFTPTLDRLAAEGVSFRSAFCQNPVCTPSRCSFMSGWYPHVAGHRTMTHMMHPGEPVLLKELKDNGYRVWMNQRNDLLPAQLPDYEKDYCTDYQQIDSKGDEQAEPNWRGEEGGKNYYSFFEGRTTGTKEIDDIFTDGAVDFINNYDSEQPFCIFLPWMNPHPPYKGMEPYFSMIDRSKLSERIKAPENYDKLPKMLRGLRERMNMDDWTEEEYDELRAVYLGQCAKVDDMTERVLQALKERGFYDNTAVFFFSDHGDFTGDYGVVEKAQNLFMDCLTNVPFIVKLPKELQEVQQHKGVSGELTELVDFYATAADLAQLPQTHTHFGRSLLPYLRGEEEHVREEVHCEGGFMKGEEHCKERGNAPVVSKNSPYYPRQSLQASDDMYNGKAMMVRTERYKYVRRYYETDELYDLEKDPQELCNRIDDPDYRDVLADMKERALDHMLGTADVVPLEKDTRWEPAFMKVMMS